MPREVLVDDEARSRWQTISAQLTEGGQSGEPTALPTASWQDLLTRTIATNFTGDIEQVPNTFSAIKINGQRAYDLAREGKDVELKPARHHQRIHRAGYPQRIRSRGADR